VYVDGNPAATGRADGARPDLAAAFPDRVFADHANAHGFDLTLGVAAGRHTVCVILHNAGLGGGSSRVGCSAVDV
jgi:hypothetical protein